MVELVIIATVLGKVQGILVWPTRLYYQEGCNAVIRQVMARPRKKGVTYRFICTTVEERSI
jgi:hypothetical protein